MKRWIWLLVLPWIVEFSTTTQKYEVVEWVDKSQMRLFACTGPGRQWCDDFAYLMNEAHRRRTEKKEPCEIEKGIQILP